MNHIAIPASAIGKGDYHRHVLECGHIPGVLSGAELRGKAKRWGGIYARLREKVEIVAERYGVTSEVIAIETGATRRACRVWVDRMGSPCRIVIVEG